MKTLADLQALREKAQESTRLREGEKAKRIIVGMGTCGIAAGARDVLAAIMDEIEKRGLTDVMVTQTGCVGMCEQEPMVEVVMDQSRVMYGLVDEVKARKIVAQHIVNGQMIGEWVIQSK